MSTNHTRSRAGAQIVDGLLFANYGYRDLKVDIFTPEGPPGSKYPLIVWIHGGGFFRGDRKKAPDLARYFASSGFVMASLEYRLGQEARYPAQLVDIRTGIEFLRAHAAEHSIDADHVGLWGASAGGTLAALAGLCTTDDAHGGKGWASTHGIRAIVECYGPSDLTADAATGDVPVPGLEPGENAADRLLGRDSTTELAIAASPVHQAHSAAPPILICHGDNDALVPVAHARHLHDALVRAGSDSDLYIVKGYRHGFVNDRRQGDLAADSEGTLLDGGRLVADVTTSALHWSGNETTPQPTEFGFSTIEEFFARHLR